MSEQKEVKKIDPVLEWYREHEGKVPAPGYYFGFFTYNDVAHLIVEKRKRWNSVTVYFDKKASELYATPSGVEVPRRWIKLYEWSVDEERDLERDDTILKLSNLGEGHDELYDKYKEDKKCWEEGFNCKYWVTFAEMLRERGEYDQRIILYLIKRMRDDKLAAIWKEEIKKHRR